MPATLVLSDLHLPAAAGSPYREAFLRFCAGPARRAGRVYLLGDVFEHWLGDDLSLPEHAEEVAALAAVSADGIELAVQPGNRDFLLGQAFARATGARLMADEEVTPLAGEPTLLAHGDLYCTADRAYQAWRRFSRNPVAQWLYTRLPAAQRRRIAGGLKRREAEGEHATPTMRRNGDDILDVNPDAISAAFRRHRVRRLVHGHTHRPGLHRLAVDGRACERIVLPDWRPQRMQWLHAPEHGALTLRSFDGVTPLDTASPPLL